MSKGWTLESLKTHFEAIIKANDKRYKQRFEDQDSAVKAALASAEKAVAREQENSEKWRASANEWRGAMNDRERDLMPRTEAEQAIKANTDKINEITKRIERNESGWKYLVAAITLIATIIGAYLALVKHG